MFEALPRVTCTVRAVPNATQPTPNPRLFALRVLVAVLV